MTNRTLTECDGCSAEIHAGAQRFTIAIGSHPMDFCRTCGEKTVSVSVGDVLVYAMKFDAHGKGNPR